MAASISVPSVRYVYQGAVVAQPSQAVAVGATGSGTIFLATTSQVVSVTAISAISAANFQQTLSFTAELPPGPSPTVSPSGVVTFYFAQQGSNDLPNTAFAFPIVTLTSISARPANATISNSTTSATLFSSSEPVLSTTYGSTSETWTPSATASGTITTSTRAMYSAGTVAGSAVGCAVAGVVLTVLLFLFCFRKRVDSPREALRTAEKSPVWLEGHGQNVRTTSSLGESWMRHLPQADSDSTIREKASRVLDQIAMHVENFYGRKVNMPLREQHRLNLENIDTSYLPEPIWMVLQKDGGHMGLIKHYMSSYIISNIDFEDRDTGCALLPPAFCQEWQCQSDTLTRAHSNWRVLTAYLQHNAMNRQTRVAEQNKGIHSVATQICRAFEPWATSDEDTRLQNLVGIMKRANELGVLLFAQPAKFEWQWLPAEKSGTAITNGTHFRITALPGLFKTTDQHAVSLASPLRLVEPVFVSLANLEPQ